MNSFNQFGRKKEKVDTELTWINDSLCHGSIESVGSVQFWVMTPKSVLNVDSENLTVEYLVDEKNNNNNNFILLKQAACLLKL